VQLGKRKRNLGAEELSLFFRESLNLHEVLKELAALHKLHDEVDSEIVLEHILHSHKERVVV
jgi:hypothetical protein